MGDDFRGVTDFGNGFTRMPIEDHYDFPPDEGYIVVPSRGIPENWTSAADVAALKFLDRDFIFPGEQVHILVHVSVEDSGPEIVTSFKVAAAMNKLAAKKAREVSVKKSSGDDGKDSDVLNPKESAVDQIAAKEVGKVRSGESPEHATDANGVNAEFQTNQLGSPDDSGPGPSLSPTTLLQEEEKAKRSHAILEGFRRSHYYVRIMENGEPLWQKRVVGAGGRSGAESRAEDELTKLDDHGCTPIQMELGKFDPSTAGGLARHAVACAALGNGDIVHAGSTATDDGRWLHHG